MIQPPSNLSELRNIWRFANSLAIKESIKIVNAKDTTKFYIYDVIGLMENEASDFVQAIHTAKTDSIDLHINSPGGFVWDAISMYDALVNAPQKVNVEINGLAASAASVLAMAGDTIKIAEPGRMMIHDAQGVAMGGPSDMQEYTDLLHSVSDDISGIYAKRAGGDPKAWRKAMTTTTWYNSSQAIDSKLADSLTDTSNKGPDNRTRLIQARARVLVGGK